MIAPWDPPDSARHHCQLELGDGNGPWTRVELDDSGSLARPLFDAVVQAGAEPFYDPAHGYFVRISDARVQKSRCEFEDRSNHFPPPEPNVEVGGPAAAGVLEAFVAAGIRDDNEEGTLFLACTDRNGAASCVSAVVLPDGFATTIDLTSYEAGPSARLFGAFAAVAAAVSLPPNGGAGPLMTINARNLSFDGTKLRLHLVTSTVVAPPLPPPPTE